MSKVQLLVSKSSHILRAIMAVLLIGCEPDTSLSSSQLATSKSQKKLVDVYVDRVSASELADKLVVGGWLEAKDQRFVFSQVQGVIGKIFKFPNADLSKGGVILEVVPDGAGWEVKPHPVVSDLKGKVMRLLVDQGDRVDPSKRLAMIGDISSYDIRGQATYSDLHVIHSSSKIEVVLPAVGKKPIGRAKVDRIDPAADPRTGTFGVRFRLLCAEQQCQEQARAGLLAKVIIKSNIRSGILIPEKWLHRRGAEQHVYVLVAPKQGDDQAKVVDGQEGANDVKLKNVKRVKKVVVTIGEALGIRSEIVSGLNVDDLVVVSSASNIKDGDMVHISKDLSDLVTK